MRKSTIYLFTLGLVVVVLMAVASAGLVVSAQNANSSMTMEKPAKPKKSRKPKATGTGRCDPMQQEQVDLSGTYTGKMRHENGPAEDATLTVTGNNFTATSGSDTRSGRITAVSTCGYIAVTMMMGDLTPPAPSPNPPPALPAMSLRAKKVGNGLTLTSVPGEPKQVWFSTSGSGAKPKSHRAKSKKMAPAAPAKTTP